jgi:hypothetical protein
MTRRGRQVPRVILATRSILRFSPLQRSTFSATATQGWRIAALHRDAVKISSLVSCSRPRLAGVSSALR